MPELLLHYIWLRRAFEVCEQRTTDGRLIKVIDVGVDNLDAGPDFFNAKILIDGMLWAGNVEIHICSSDWYLHKHHNDPAYDNVILHIVKKADKKVYNSKGEAIVQCEIKYPHAEEQLAQLLQDKLSLCNQRLIENPELITEDWKRCLLQDRLKKKTAAIAQLLTLIRNNWEEAFYITLAHNFGFHTNGLPFEMTAKQTPLSYLLKHRDNLFQLEAMLFGQSGLLNDTTATDNYSKSLLNEYKFLQKKFSLRPIEGSMWKLLRMRPQNFPHVRIAQFAQLLHQSEFLFSKIISQKDINLLRQNFAVKASEYWDTHYRFGAQCPKSEKLLGKSSTDLLLINSIVPYQYAYNRAVSNEDAENSAETTLRNISAEKNHIIEQWKILGMKIRNAADSQTFIHLYQNYCQINKCAQCDVGYQIFTMNE